MIPSGPSNPNQTSHTGLQAGALALLVRGALLIAIFCIWGRSWYDYLSSSDAGSFLPVARVIAGLEHADQLKLYDTRVFLGWPLIIAPFLALGLPQQSALVLVLLGAALAPWLYARLTNDFTSAWLLAVFPPAWLLATIHPISEAVYLVLIVAGCLAVQRHRWFLTGLAAGSLVLVRPFGIAWVIAFALPLLRTQKSRSNAAAYIFGGLLMAAVLVWANLSLYHDLLHQFYVYARPLSQLNLPAASSHGELPAGHWGWPFVSLVSTPFHYQVPPWKILYIDALAAVSLLLIGKAGCQLRDPDLPGWQQAALAGFIGNTVLSFCTGPYWGFHSFDRYLIWGLPGALVAAQPWLQRWRWLPWILAASSIAMTAFAVWIRFR